MFDLFGLLTLLVSMMAPGLDSGAYNDAAWVPANDDTVVALDGGTMPPPPGKR